mmetsp:Transcript_36811/g.64856  ORF Transcript_36811/g.64856 Transcript_36811/m.64856 type:complete len:380 (-) Transcript_36811:67-1206(-)
MPSTEEDFGKVCPHFGRTRAPGVFIPHDLIGRDLTEFRDDLPTDKPWPRNHEIPELARMNITNSQALNDAAYSSRQPKKPQYSANMRSQIDEAVYGHDIDFSGQCDVEEEFKKYIGSAGRSNREVTGAESRRLKKSVYDRDGKVVDCQNQSDGKSRPEGIKQVDETPTPQKHPYAGSKRCFDWKYKPTAWDNPVTFEEPPEPGKRPSHPVCNYGPVSTDRIRSFPEKKYPATGIPPPKMNKQPVGNEWGGWAKKGEPGRKPADGPWQVVPRGADENAEADFRVSDARVKRFPEMKYGDTTHITTWHFDPKHDIDPVKTSQVTKLEPLGSKEAFGNRHHDRDMLWGPPAGKPTYIAVEGTPLESYDRIRRHERQQAMSAR